MDSIYLVIALGPIIGLISAILGVGGGVVIIPALYWLFPNLSGQMVIGTSLGIIFVNSFINSLNFIRVGFPIKRKYIVTIGLCCMLGSLISASVANYLSKDQLRFVFALVLMGVVLRLLFMGQSVKNESPSSTSQIKLGVTGFLGGIVSGLTGLGGGAIFLPLLISYAKVPFKLVSAYSNMGMLFTSFIGFMVFALATPKSPNSVGISIGNVNITIILCLSFGVLLISKSAIKWGDKISEKTRKNLFLTLLSFIVLKEIYSFLS